MSDIRRNLLGRRPRHYSGRFVLRIDPSLHSRLRAEADALGRSLNDHCARRLAAPDPLLPRAASNVLARVVAGFGDGLVGVVAYGSWARDQVTAGSDVDLLIVLEAVVPITRGLYRTWDEERSTWDGNPVEPHFVHPPPPGSAPSAVWAEVAVDGVVVYERELRISRWLAEVRRRIVAGSIERRHVHGHPYWVEAD